MPQVDLWSPQFLANPYPTYKELRDYAPCFYDADSGVFIISRYQDVALALKDWETFSSAEGVGYERSADGMLVGSDPPEHTGLRKHLAGVYSPGSIRRLEVEAHALLLDTVSRVDSSNPVDLVEAIAEPFPIAFIALFMGIDQGMSRKIKEWSYGFFELLSGRASEDLRERLDSVQAEALRWFGEHVRARRHEPNRPVRDLIDVLMTPLDPDGLPLSDREIELLCINQLAAGNETTTSLMGNGLVALIENPSQWALLRQQPALATTAVEEMLRYDSPVQAYFRSTTRSVQVHGVSIPAGARVMLSCGSANRDERAFDDPDGFLIERYPRHLAFGLGRHLCIGKDIARLESRLFFEMIADRETKLVPAGRIERRCTPILRGVAHLPVMLGV